MSPGVASVIAWVLMGTGIVVWGAVLLWIVGVFVEPRSSNVLSYGCNDCDWWIRDPEKRRWWTLKPQYRWHRVIAHRDWPPQYRHPVDRPTEKPATPPRGFPR